MPGDPRHTQVSVDGRVLHVVESGDPEGRPFLFLHGWPESWRAWAGVMAAAGRDARVIAIDLPGVGESAGAVPGGAKSALAEVVRGLAERLELADLTLCGHDAGGMVAYAYLRRYSDAGRVVIMNTVIPGVDPWRQVIANPAIWHFGLHAVPDLPETLVRGRQAEYFGHFYDVLSAEPARIGAEARAAHAAAYRDDAALTAGFDLYRAFPEDARDNAAFAGGAPVDTPLLYLRGDGEYGDIAAYARGFRDAGLRNVTTAVIPDAGHFAPEEAPARVWRAVRDFAATWPRP
ncbi:alpha/beta hydrolase [Sphaerisporangium rufum]|uniref:Alpha/beta hydrolase n=1 Tax=Sphaerisporangium rufum TaxID=1381558 RepID=A0A919R4X1_9ACTN|nr:alpha/beta hydrolase [Sphaerisporangium rufum]GII77137.1 alpha/beta hydrolase [Sphaerisporangium rufum]